MFALIVEVEVLVFDLGYVCLKDVRLVVKKITWRIHPCDVTLVRFLNRLFIPLLVDQIDKTLISVQ